jgi:hypothetical protein
MSVLTRHVALVSESSSVSFSDVTEVAAALQKQAVRDFDPLWQVNTTVDGFESLDKVPVDYWPVIIRDDLNEPGAAGYHTDDNGQPFSLVQADAGWTLTASHETLEMLADPFGNRTIAGKPPVGAPKPVSSFKRVLYLVEVCDPCEAAQYAYTVNGIELSDFITSHYYDPKGRPGVLYSFGGNVQQPHSVLEGGYISFSDPKTQIWYQIEVFNGQMHLVTLGRLNRNGRSLREAIDDMVRARRTETRYRTSAAMLTRKEVSEDAEESAARAKTLHETIKRLAATK